MEVGWLQLGGLRDGLSFCKRLLIKVFGRFVSRFFVGFDLHMDMDWISTLPHLDTYIT